MAEQPTRLSKTKRKPNKLIEMPSARVRIRQLLHRMSTQLRLREEPAPIRLELSSQMQVVTAMAAALVAEMVAATVVASVETVVALVVVMAAVEVEMVAVVSELAYPPASILV